MRGSLETQGQRVIFLSHPSFTYLFPSLLAFFPISPLFLFLSLSLYFFLSLPTYLPTYYPSFLLPYFRAFRLHTLISVSATYVDIRLRSLAIAPTYVLRKKVEMARESLQAST
ncbi:hypothetical protein HZH66_013292 [Vespula vulgaris]|uniref:Uncharacterized protein n=1 Tax=Vespula vulgaris TaxID=7454 RepID=A0A834MRV9_VESVU|nr:hypothetical protein HZH66_013292 [Vespula vulgaris]